MFHSTFAGDLVDLGDRNGADDGIRTRDPNLGKVVLYQLSHVRVTAAELSTERPAELGSV